MNECVQWALPVCSRILSSQTPAESPDNRKAKATDLTTPRTPTSADLAFSTMTAINGIATKLTCVPPALTAAAMNMLRNAWSRKSETLWTVPLPGPKCSRRGFLAEPPTRVCPHAGDPARAELVPTNEIGPAKCKANATDWAATITRLCGGKVGR
jgi:hypothetical protein